MPLGRQASSLGSVWHARQLLLTSHRRRDAP
jgi:hypothetical protein